MNEQEQMFECKDCNVFARTTVMSVSPPAEMKHCPLCGGTNLRKSEPYNPQARLEEVKKAAEKGYSGT